MKKILLSLSLIIVMSCCKKTTETPQQFVEAIVYVQKINWANYNEPDLMHYYVVQSKKKKGYWFCYRAGGIIDFKNAQWEYATNTPVSPKYFESKGGRLGVNPFDIPGYFNQD